MEDFGAVVLSGGAGRRMGGPTKPLRPVGGRPMRDRVLDAVADAYPRVVVGPVDPGLPSDVRVTREQPPGGGPVAAVAAGLARLDPGTSTVALLAADLPLLTGADLHPLRDRLAAHPAVDGVCYLDRDGRRQTLCGVWRVASLRAALDRIAGRRGDLAGAALRELLADLVVAEVGWAGDGLPPWYDCDTGDDVRRVEEWLLRR